MKLWQIGIFVTLMNACNIVYVRFGHELTEDTLWGGLIAGLIVFIVGFIWEVTR